VTGRAAQTLSVALVALAAVASAVRPARASLLGEENVTLVQQLAELLKIRRELEDLSEGIVRVADAVENSYALYRAAQGGWDELASYSTDRFVADFRRDVYEHYPGFEILVEGRKSRRLRAWATQGRPKSPATAYEMISAVFADATDPLVDEARFTDEHEAALRRFEAAGALSLSADAERATRAFDDTALQLAQLADDPDLNPGRAQIVQARAMTLLAVQNSHIIRLLSRRVRLDGIENAIAYGRRLRDGRDRMRWGESMGSYFQSDRRAPRLMKFARPW